MLSQIKLYIIGAVTGLFALLGLYAKYQSSQKEKYKQKLEVSEEKSESIEKRIEAHEKREEIDQTTASIVESVVDDRLQQYYRD